jgi:ATP-dependent DNA ligase
MEEDTVSQLTNAFELGRDKHDEAVLLRRQTWEVVAEANAIARAAEHEALILKSRVPAHGKNSEERAMNLILDLEEGEYSQEYKSLQAEITENRRTAAAGTRTIESLSDEIKFLQIQAQLLANLASKIL